MTKSTKTAIICLVLGILLMGAGCVMVFFNVSTITYGGQKAYVSESADINETYTESIGPKVEKIRIYTNNDNWDVSLQEDENVSENEIAFDITRPGDVALWRDYNLIDQYNNSFGSMESFDEYVRDVANGNYDEYIDNEYYDDDYYDDDMEYSAGEYRHHGEHIDHNSLVLRNRYANNGADIRLEAEAGFDLECGANGPKAFIRAMKDLKESNAYYNYVGSGKLVIRINPVNASKVIY